MENKKNYYAIIPASVRYDKRVKPNAKLLYGEITALCNEKGYCWASNDYFASLYEVKKETISRWITDLVRFGYLKRTVAFKEGTNQIINRYLFLNQEGIDEKINTPIDEKVKDNNTSFNNTFNNNMSSKHDSIPFKEIIDYLNVKTGKNFKNIVSHQKIIKARFNDGFTVDDFKKVIDLKNKEWSSDKKMSEYLRPATLFGNKMDNYLNSPEQPYFKNKNISSADEPDWSEIYGKDL